MLAKDMIRLPKVADPATIMGRFKEKFSNFIGSRAWHRELFANIIQDRIEKKSPCWMMRKIPVDHPDQVFQETAQCQGYVIFNHFALCHFKGQYSPSFLTNLLFLFNDWINYHFPHKLDVTFYSPSLQNVLSWGMTSLQSPLNQSSESILQISITYPFIQLLTPQLYWGIILKIVFKTSCMQAGSHKSLILHACASIYIIICIHLHLHAFICIHSFASIPLQVKGSFPLQVKG